MKKYPLYIFVIILFLLGCQDLNTKQEANEKLESKPGRVIVLGIDETGSYKLWAQVKNTVARIIQQLEPGDIFYFRRITDASYLDSCTIFRLELPYLKEPENDNPFNRKAKNLRRSHIYHINSLKREACQRLADIQFTNAGHTDIFGFLTASNEKFCLAPREFKRILIIASDLKDNVGHKVRFDLSGVYVTVIGFQASKHPGKTQILKDSWTKMLTQAGAAKVIFLSIEERFSANYFKR